MELPSTGTCADNYLDCYSMISSFIDKQHQTSHANNFHKLQLLKLIEDISRISHLGFEIGFGV